jgi:hypothetical protein
LSTRVHIILTASSGVADKLRTGSQPIPSKLSDKIREQATPSDPEIMHSMTLDHLAGVEYTSFLTVPSANILRDTTEKFISYESINQGSKWKMNTIQRVSVNTRKMINFTI